MLRSPNAQKKSTQYPQSVGSVGPSEDIQYLPVAQPVASHFDLVIVSRIRMSQRSLHWECPVFDSRSVL